MTGTAQHGFWPWQAHVCATTRVPHGLQPACRSGLFPDARAQADISVPRSCCNLPGANQPATAIKRARMQGITCNRSAMRWLPYLATTDKALATDDAIAANREANASAMTQLRQCVWRVLHHFCVTHVATPRYIPRTPFQNASLRRIPR
jgi:hypothetical protein